MWNEIERTVTGFRSVLRAEDGSPWRAALPLIVMALVWPLALGWLGSEPAAFMLTFILGAALRLGSRAEARLRRLAEALPGQGAAVLALLLGPLVFAGLVLSGDPVWVQDFVALYFLAMAGLYALDAPRGGHDMTRTYIPGRRPAAADRLMAWVMAVLYLALAGVTAAMAQLSLELWLVYFGLRPFVVKRLAEALARTVEMAWAKGYGRF